MPDIAPCRFCRSKRVEVWMRYPTCYHVECERCGAAGPQAGFENEAIAWWNAGAEATPAQVKRWRARLKEAERLAEIERANSPEARRQQAEAAKMREYHDWVAKRYAWLHAPITKEADPWSGTGRAGNGSDM
jgi:hypothetical protein